MNQSLLTLIVCLCASVCLLGQSTTYSGRILSVEDEEPLIGVNVLIVNSSKGTITDFNGDFSLEANPGDTLEVSYIGYNTQYITLGNNTTINIRLASASEILDEVVVVGYGTVKKSDLTGSVASVKSEEIVKVPAANALQSLQGKVAGLQISSVSGDPGADPVVRLRGITTLNNNDPIAVIDGVITEIGAVALLNANDIASIEVLKDASAAAIYGSRGAAGVIIVTTKKGESGRTRVSFTYEQSFESAEREIDVMDGREFATFINAINPGTYNNLDALPDVNWQEEIYQDFAPLSNANLSFSGGSEKYNFYFGLGYFNQEGILPKSALERITGKLNIGFAVTDFAKVGLDLTVLADDKQNAPGVVTTALRAWPINEPFLADGETFAEVQGGNPLAAIEFQNSNTNRLRSLGNLYLDINFLRGFTFRTSAQFNLAEAKTRSFSPQFFVGPLQQNEINDLTYRTQNNTSLIFENTLSYNKSFSKHTINAVVGYTAQDIRQEFLEGFTEGLIREDETFRYLDAGLDDFERVSNNLDRSTLISYLGRVNYVFDSRYLFTVSIRRDGSSRFGVNNRYGNFPSFAAGWNLHNEDFFPDGGIVDNLKIRGSWGIIGNERINNRAQFALITGGNNAVFGPGENLVGGATFDGGGNPDLKWEETTQFNIGLDATLLEGRVVAEIDYYQKTTNDILVSLEPIGYTGIGSFRSIFFNAANVENSGIELNLSYRDQIQDFTYQIGVLGTTINNKVLDIGEDIGADSLIIGGDLGNGQRVTRTAVGQPIGYFFGYETIGVFQNQAEIDANPTLFGQQPGDLRYRDVNGDGVINAQDRVNLGSSIPDLIYGFNAALGYKNFLLSADFQGQVGGLIYNGKQVIRFTTLNYEDRFNDYWTGEGSTNEDPRPTLGGNNFLPSDYFLEDASFLRLRTLTLNYQLPSSLQDKLRMASANVYVRGTNLFTATEFTGYSPEIGAGDATDGVIDRGVYPITRVYTVGLNANF